jgi:hypothetical protein
MATQTETNTEQQGTHFYVMTVRKALGSGLSAENTISGHMTPPSDWTRGDFYQALYADMIAQHPQLAGAATLFFTVDRNQL